MLQKVIFPEAPCNTQITVVLETDTAVRKIFEVARTCEEGPHEEPPPDV